MPESADFQTLFSQLQSRYPFSSLTSELVQIQADQYVVRAVVQIGGVVLATSMAAAATVELAEDQARLRVLKMLGIHSATFREPELHAAENGIPSGRSDYFLDSGNSLSNSFRGSLDTATFEDTLPPSLPALDQIFPSSTSSLPASSLPLDPPSLAEAPAIGGASEGSSSTTLEGLAQAPERSSAPPPEPTPLPEAASSSDRPVAEVPPRSSKSRKAVTPPEPSPEPSTPSLNEPLDLTPLFLQIEDEMDRIGWTKEQGRSHLKRTYNKRSRQQLTDEELVDFLAHLKTQSLGGEE